MALGFHRALVAASHNVVLISLIGLQYSKHHHVVCSQDGGGWTLPRQQVHVSR
jgi:DNA-binding FadR family transcriptional regulator